MTEKTNNTEYSPHEREVIGTVLHLWNDTPALETLSATKLLQVIKFQHPTWSLSEKRLKTILKQHSLTPQASTSDQFTYVKQTRSKPMPGLEMPKGVKLQTTKARGKGLYATKVIPEGDLLWEEEPLLVVPPVDNVTLMRKALACAYCGRTFRLASSECPQCAAKWCSPKCKKMDTSTIHAALWHDSKHTKVDLSKWVRYEEFCLENDGWAAAYAYGRMAVSTLKSHSKPGEISLKDKLDALAEVRQDIRQQAVGQATTSLGGGGLVGEQHEALWHKGHELLQDAVKSAADISYEEYLYGLGRYNMNNVDGNIYALHSHLNHSCEPNAKVDVVSRTSGIKVVALRDISANEELTVTYVNPSDPLNKRRNELRVNWGFICMCPRCKREEHEINETAEKYLEGKIEFEQERRKSVRFEDHSTE
ncbi:histone-lysine N-methyltransferase Set5p [Trichomonascus vanleenenianus]|uniref:S-adenosylmethionine-dependent methyltransferase n=1 Tax=Trichomonascus vanleenenianus TaxID=2268995 RepID=UPI003EC9D82F